MEHIALNRSERMYLALEGVAGSLTQVYAVRFGAPVEADAVRQALRRVIGAHPRLRAVIERTLLGHRLAVIPDGRGVDELFALAFRVESAGGGTDDAALAEQMGLLLSESFSVERDLPIKARFIPDRARPALVLSMHHIAGDGRSVLGWIRSLHRVLNGEELAPVPVDPPGHLPALVPESLGDMPRALMEELRAFAGASRPGPYRRAPHQHLDSYGPIAVFPHRLSSPGSALVAAARARGTTVGTLIFSAAALAFHRLAPGPSGDVIRARLSIDLRDLYPAGRTPGDGNYVSSFVVDVDPRIGIDAMLPAIDASTRANIERYKRRSMMMTSLSREASTWLGRHQTGRVALYAKRLDRHTTQSFHLSNLGRIDGLESGGIPVECVLPSLAHPDLMIPFIGFGGNLTINVSYPRAEVSRDFIRALVIEIDEVLAPLGHTAASDARARLRASN